MSRRRHALTAILSFGASATGPGKVSFGTCISLIACLLAACTGQKSYHSDHQANLFITTETESNGWFSGIDASLDIYEMHDICDVAYRGTVNLGESQVAVGVPEGVPTYLVFRIDRSAFLTNTRSSLGYDVALYPEYGQVYDVNVIYRNDMYRVEVEERRRGSTDGQLLAIGMAEHPCYSGT